MFVHGFYIIESTLLISLLHYFHGEGLLHQRGGFKCRNICDDENSHATQPHRLQQRFNINVWPSDIDGHLTGSHVLPCCLSGPRHQVVLEEELVELFEDLSLSLRQEIVLN